MIITKLQGGLGNQLFQWAVTRNLSLIYNTDYYFDMSYFVSKKQSKTVSKWNFELDKFKKIRIKESVNNLLPIIKDTYRYQVIPNNSFLDGYWHSEKFFKENENVIRSELEIDEKIKFYILNKYSFLSDNTVSLHVRRGDYVNLDNIYYQQSINYYKSAYDIINDTSSNIIVLSNDIAWCKENLKFNNMKFIEGESNIVDLYIMSLCKHNIIANSSFSWWGAWLNNNPTKKVIAPLHWMKKINDSDFVPSNWVRI